MPAKWKSNKNLKPDIILDKIDSTKTIANNGGVSYTGFLYDNAMIALKTMIAFPKAIPEIVRESLLSKAVNNIAQKSNLSNVNVINELNQLIKIELKTKEQKYYLLTSISIRDPIPIKYIKINDCIIRIFKSNFPKKYESRDQVNNNYKNEYKFNQRGYSNVIISVKNKSAYGAATACLDSLDLLRGIWCLLSNSRLQIIGEEWVPINSVRLGEVHTIHNTNGTIGSSSFWYEPNFILANPLDIKKIETFKRNTNFLIRKLNECKYSKILREAIIRYVRALDEKDQNTATIRLWGALESVASPNFQSYSQLTTRVSFLFDEFNYHKQVLEHLREYRNQSVHSGDQYDLAKTICFQLQYYFYHLILFHLRNTNEFSSLEEANTFLDLPRDKKILERKIKIFNSAIEFLSKR